MPVWFFEHEAPFAFITPVSLNQTPFFGVPVTPKNYILLCPITFWAKHSITKKKNACPLKKLDL